MNYKINTIISNFNVIYFNKGKSKTIDLLFVLPFLMYAAIIYILIASFLIFLCKFKVRNISWNYLMRQKFVTEQKIKLSISEAILGVFITSSVIDGFSDSYNDIYASYENKNSIAKIPNSGSDGDSSFDGGGDW